MALKALSRDELEIMPPGQALTALVSSRWFGELERLDPFPRMEAQNTRKYRV